MGSGSLARAEWLMANYRQGVVANCSKGHSSRHSDAGSCRMFREGNGIQAKYPPSKGILEAGKMTNGKAAIQGLVQAEYEKGKARCAEM